jgi:hypothetical protein
MKVLTITVAHHMTQHEALRMLMLMQKVNRFTPASSIWLVGKIMYDVAYLTYFTQYYDDFRELPKGAAEQEQRYTDVGGNMVDPTVTKPNYSQKLHDLIDSCMEISQEARPCAEDLVRTTREALDSWIQTARAMNERQRQEIRVFYKGSVINDMAPGPNDFAKSQELFDQLMKNKYGDATLPPLDLPEKGWRGLKRKFERE